MGILDYLLLDRTNKNTELAALHFYEKYQV